MARWFSARGFVQPYNSRVFKTVAADGGLVSYEVRLASAATGVVASIEVPVDDALSALNSAFEFEGTHITVSRGDYAPLLQRVVHSLRAASAYAENETQRAALAAYARAFETGAQTAHIEGSSLWVSDIGPVVESYLGFIESYRDPAGVRGEWEGFVAVVNKVASARLTRLVDEAPALLPLLPWGAAFEKDSFKRPDFTSLDILAFGSSGVPAGINIPNYDIVRQSSGFKNVSLGNVLQSRTAAPGDRVTFLADADQALVNSLTSPAFELQVGLHELLGHGSGKMFIEAPDGSRNFPAGTIDPTTGAPVASFYMPGETWDSVFSSDASALEECRAEAVGLVLSAAPTALAVFGYAAPAGGDVADVTYVNWLWMARSGLVSLQMFTPGVGWGQAHSRARYAILNVLLRAGVATLSEGATALNADDIEAGHVAEGDAGVHVRLDRSLILSVGVPAVNAFLVQLQAAKATANVAAARALFEPLTTVPLSWLPLRALVIAKRAPRAMMLQPVLSLASSTELGPTAEAADRAVVGGVCLRSFPATIAGLINAFVARFPVEDPALLALAAADAPFHEIKTST